MATEPLKIVEQIGENGGTMKAPDSPGIGVEPDIKFLERFAVS